MYIIFIWLLLPKVKTCKGKLNLKGDGIWKMGITEYSVIEMEGKQYKNIQVNGYLDTYFQINNFHEVIISKGLSRSFVMAIKTNGNSYKISFGSYFLSMFYKLLIWGFVFTAIIAIAKFTILGNLDFSILLLWLTGIVLFIYGAIRFLLI